jgi:hypothetical protein
MHRLRQANDLKALAVCCRPQGVSATDASRGRSSGEREKTAEDKAKQECGRRMNRSWEWKEDRLVKKRTMGGHDWEAEQA